MTFVNPIPRKGVEIAFALAARRPDIPFEFVEAWKLRNRVRANIEARAAHHGNVRFVASTPDMKKIYENSRVVLAPSLWDEAWGRVVSEAQVSGIPAIVSDSCGLPLATGRGGIVVSRDAPLSEWVSALGALWDDFVNYEHLSGSGTGPPRGAAGISAGCSGRNSIGSLLRADRANDASRACTAPAQQGRL